MDPNIAMQRYNDKNWDVDCARRGNYFPEIFNKKENRINVFDISQGGILQEQYYGYQKLHKFDLININLNEPPSLIKQKGNTDNPIIITLINCRIGSQFISSLVESIKQLKLLIFEMCSLGNLFFDEKLSKTYHKLISLSIKSDEFGNRGLKILLLTDNLKLKKLSFTNTNLTTDCIKILNNYFVSSCKLIGFKSQKHFQMGRVIKECGPMLGQYEKTAIEGDFYQYRDKMIRQNNFVYMNNFVKIKFLPNQCIRFLDNQLGWFTILSCKHMLVPPKTKSILFGYVKNMWA